MGALVTYFLIALCASFVCSLLEAVLLSLTPAHIVVLERNESRFAPALRGLKDNIDRSLASILTLNTIANMVGAAGVGAEAAALRDEALRQSALAGVPLSEAERNLGFVLDHAVGISAALLTIAILVLSEIIPKTIGALYWKRLAPVAATVVPLLIFVTFPAVWMLRAISRLFAGKDLGNGVTRDEIAVSAQLGAEGGALEHRETRIITNLLKLRNVYVKDVMTPRSVMVAFPSNLTVADVWQQNPQLRFSRIPVYGEHTDEILGFVTRYRVMHAYASGATTRTLSTLCKPIDAVPEVMNVARLLDEFLHRRQQILLVVDEYGGTAGLVTLEDAMETLLGVEIVDELDSVEDMRKLARELWEKRKARVDNRGGKSRREPSPAGEPQPKPPEPMDGPASSENGTLDEPSS